MKEAELDALLNALVPFAQQQLAKRSGFHPFGATLAADGRVTPVAIGGEEPADAASDIEALLHGFRSRAREDDLRAVALCWDATITEGNTRTDAIAVGLEHAEGDAMNVFVPYRKRRLRGYAFGELVAGPREASVFVERG